MRELKALIYGTGFAAKGHTEALAWCGVPVVCMVGRNPEVTARAAAEAGIPSWGTDLERAFDEHHPDIVAIGTPGGAHAEPIRLAAEFGAALFCDKPLAPDGEQAGEFYRTARSAGVKTAFAASFRYQPQVRYAAQLVARGELGEVLEIECVSHYNLNPLIPHSWSHLLAEGGGRLNNNFTHKLSIAEAIVGVGLRSVCGETRNDMHRAPVGESTHDFRTREDTAPTPDQLGGVEWRPVDSDWSYSVLARLGSPTSDPASRPSATFRHSGIQPSYHEDYITVYGSGGALYLQGAYATGRIYRRARSESQWTEVTVPASIHAELPDIESDVQRNWTMLMSQLVRDLKGEAHEPYQAFLDGWVYQQAIDAVRDARGWIQFDSNGVAQGRTDGQA